MKKTFSPPIEGAKIGAFLDNKIDVTVSNLTACSTVIQLCLLSKCVCLPVCVCSCVCVCLYVCLCVCVSVSG